MLMMLMLFRTVVTSLLELTVPSASLATPRISTVEAACPSQARARTPVSATPGEVCQPTVLCPGAAPAWTMWRAGTVTSASQAPSVSTTSTLPAVWSVSARE